MTQTDFSISPEYKDCKIFSGFMLNIERNIINGKVIEHKPVKTIYFSNSICGLPVGVVVKEYTVTNFFKRLYHTLWRGTPNNALACATIKTGGLVSAYYVVERGQ